MRGPAVDTAAQLTLLGLPALHYLTTEDEDERVLLEAVAIRAGEHLERMNRQAAG